MQQSIERAIATGWVYPLVAFLIVLSSCSSETADHTSVANTSGQVLTADGEPVPNALVEGEAVISPCESEEGTFEVDGSDVTDEEGKFEIQFVAPLAPPGSGCARLKVSPPVSSSLQDTTVEDVRIEFGIDEAPPSESLTIILAPEAAE